MVGLNRGQTRQPDASTASIDVLVPTDSNVIVGDGTRWVAESGETARTSLGVGTGDSPQLTAVNIGHATDTTLARGAAGAPTVEGLYVRLHGQNSQSVAYELLLADSGKQLLHPTADNNARTFTIPANAAVAFPVGTEVIFVNQINVLTIAITTDTLTLVPDNTTGSVTLQAGESAVLRKVATAAWTIEVFRSATAALKGAVELATNAEALTGTDTVRAMTAEDVAYVAYAKMGTPTFVIGAEAANVINVGIQLTDAAGVDLAVRGSIEAYLSDDANGDSIVATAPDGGWAIGTDGLLDARTANKSAMFTSEADGDIDIDITHAAGAKTVYLILRMPDGRLQGSGAIIFAA